MIRATLWYGARFCNLISNPMRHKINKRFFSTTRMPSPMNHFSVKERKIEGFQVTTIEKHKGEIYNYEVLSSLSAKLHSIDQSKLTLKRLNLTDDWSAFYKTNKNTYEIIKNEIDEELGEIAKKAIEKAGFISEIEKRGQLDRLARSRNFTETFFDVGSTWGDRFIEIFKNKIELSDNAIVAVSNVNNIIKKYYIQVHELEPPANEWSLEFPVKPINISYRR